MGKYRQTDSEPVGSFQIHYRGGLASDGLVEAESFSRSILGASKLYNSLVHYAETGTILRGKTNRRFTVYTRATRLGRSVDQEWIIVPLIAAYASDPKLYNDLIITTLKALAVFVTAWWSRPGARERELKIFADSINDMHKTSLEALTSMATERETTMRYLIRERREVNGRILDSASNLAETSARSLRELVQPVGESCDAVVQFAEDENEIVLQEHEAEEIRDGVAELTELRRYRLLGISRLNKRTGSCTVLVDELDRRGWGTILDPSLSLPNNEYTRAMNLDLELDVLAQASIRRGRVSKLYIREVVSS